MAYLLQRGSTPPLRVAVLSTYTGLRHTGLTTSRHTSCLTQRNCVSRALPGPLAPSSLSVGGASTSTSRLHFWTARSSRLLSAYPSAHSQHVLSPGLQRRPLHASSMASADLHTRTDTDTAHMGHGGLFAIPHTLLICTHNSISTRDPLQRRSPPIITGNSPISLWRHW